MTKRCCSSARRLLVWVTTTIAVTIMFQPLVSHHPMNTRFGGVHAFFLPIPIPVFINQKSPSKMLFHRLKNQKKAKIAAAALVFSKPKLVCTKRQKSRPGAMSLPASAVTQSLWTGSGGIALGVGIVGGISAILQRLQQPEEVLYTPTAGSLVGQTIVITGASTGLGLESAKRLAMGGANIVMTVRSDSKGMIAVQAVQDYLVSNSDNKKNEALLDDEDKVEDNDASTKPSQQLITYKVIDLDNIESIQKATMSEWDDISTIDVLLNNAGVMAMPERQLTMDGYERQIQSNHLGHFVLTSLLSSKFTNRTKIISVSSTAHTMAGPEGIDFDYLWTSDKNSNRNNQDSTSYQPWKSYGQSKLANIHFTKELQRRANAAKKGWLAICLHPGVVNTDLWRYLPVISSLSSNNNNDDDDVRNDGSESIRDWMTTNGQPVLNLVGNITNVFFKTPQQGATTQIWLASGAYHDFYDTEDVEGKYFIDCKPRVIDEFATNEKDAQRLWEESEQKSGVRFTII